MNSDSRCSLNNFGVRKWSLSEREFVNVALLVASLLVVLRSTNAIANFPLSTSLGAGWIALSIIFNFNAILLLNCNYGHLKELLQLDPLFEVDEGNDRMRLKDHDQWVLPGNVPPDPSLMMQPLMQQFMMSGGGGASAGSHGKPNSGSMGMGGWGGG